MTLFFSAEAAHCEEQEWEDTANVGDCVSVAGGNDFWACCSSDDAGRDEHPVLEDDNDNDDDEDDDEQQQQQQNMACIITDFMEDDPGLWPMQMNDKEGCSVVRKGPVQVKRKKKEEKFPPNREGCRFIAYYYDRVMNNCEKNLHIMACVQSEQRQSHVFLLPTSLSGGSHTVYSRQ